jgi:hypothetical protein
VCPKALATRRAISAPSLPINLEIAIVFIGVVLCLPLPARKSLFGCDVDAAKDCGAGGNSLGGCVPCRCASTESSIPSRPCQACKCEKSPDIARPLDFFAFAGIRDLIWKSRKKEQKKSG